MVLLITVSTSFAFAGTYLTDDADIFTKDKDIEKKLSELSDTIGYPVYLVTTDKDYMGTPENATDMMLYDRGIDRGDNAIILSINMSSRDIFIMATGDELLEKNIANSKILAVKDATASKLSDGAYDDAAYVYIQKARDTFGDNYVSLFDALVAAGGALLTALGYGGMQAKKYNPSPKRKPFDLHQNAVANIVKGQDPLIDTRVITRIIPKASSSGGGGGTSTTSSGRSYSGGGSKF